jgi:hypothetical protein
MGRLLLNQILRLTTNELFEALTSILPSYYTKISSSPHEYIVAEGSIPIALVAHLDTVFSENSRADMEIFYDEEQKVMWSPDGLGTDDRAGVAMILALISQTDMRPHIIFTVGEETNLDGARALSEIPCPFENLSYLLELDRQGYQECVFYGCENTNFQTYIQTFGFHKEKGSYSDISFIAPAWNTACVNLSVGYFNEHSLAEYLNLDCWHDTFMRLKRMLTAGNLEHWEYKGRKKTFHTATCDYCDKEFPIVTLKPVVIDRNSELYLCPHCRESAGVKVCSVCGKAFLPFTNEQVCDKCWDAYTYF